MKVLVDNYRFQHICYCILEDESLSRDRLAGEILPAMLKMASDPIVNVRITLGKTLAHHVITSGGFFHVLDGCLMHCHFVCRKRWLASPKELVSCV